MARVICHAVAIAATAGAITAGWVTLTLPIAAVFLIDKAFVVDDYVKFLLCATGISLAVSTLALCPCALLLEAITRRRQPVTLAVPFVLLGLSGMCLAGHWFWTRRFFDTVFQWPGKIFAFCLAFAVYCTVLTVSGWVVTALRKKTPVGGGPP